MLDTNALFWAIEAPDRLEPTTRRKLDAPETTIYATLASAQEMAMKLCAGKWPEAVGLLTHFEAAVERANFNLLSPVAADYLNMTRLPDVAGHRDPMDRLIIAMAMARDLVLVSSDANAVNYAVAWLPAGDGMARTGARGKGRIMPVAPLTPIAVAADGALGEDR